MPVKHSGISKLEVTIILLGLIKTAPPLRVPYLPKYSKQMLAIHSGMCLRQRLKHNLGGRNHTSIYLSFYYTKGWNASQPHTLPIREDCISISHRHLLEAGPRMVGLNWGDLATLRLFKNISKRIYLSCISCKHFKLGEITNLLTVSRSLGHSFYSSFKVSARNPPLNCAEIISIFKDHKAF